MLTGQFQFDYALITKPNPFFLFLLSCFPALNSRVKDKAEEMNIRCMCETWTPRRSGRGGSILKRPGRSEIRSAQLHWRNNIPSVVDRLRVLRKYPDADMVLRGGAWTSMCSFPRYWQSMQVWKWRSASLTVCLTGIWAVVSGIGWDCSNLAKARTTITWEDQADFAALD